jgi:hypothetical protein
VPTVLGEGWTSVVRPLKGSTPEEAPDRDQSLSREGGWVVTSALVTVLLLDDGRVLAGAVPADRLVELAR